MRRTLRRPAVGRVDFGDLRRVTPIGSRFGSDAGQPIDRYYIESFLERHAGDIKGRVLEIGDDRYTRQIGGNRVTQSDVLHAKQGNPKATIVADLSAGDAISSNSFDCVVLTQTLQHVYELGGAIKTLYRILRPNGVLLATVPGISQISRYDMQQWGDYWRFTTRSAKQLFLECFPDEGIRVDGYGNVLSAIAFLHGLAAEELEKDELDYQHPDFEMVITIRAVKAGRAGETDG